MLCFDTSFLAPLLLQKSASEKIESFFTRRRAGELFVSHFTRVEIVRLVAREVDMGSLAEADALLVAGRFDELVADSLQGLAPIAADFELAKETIQHFASKLRTGDALHPAVAGNRCARMFYTLDQRLLAAAKQLKVRASRGLKA